MVKENPPPDMLYSAVNNPCLRVWVDASFARLAFQGRIGILVQIVNENSPLSNYDNIVNWASKADERLHKSTGSAELAALITGLEYAHKWIEDYDFYFPVSVPVQVLTDAQVALRWYEKPFDAKPGNREAALFTRQMADDIGKVKVSYVPTKEQLADILTKYKDWRGEQDDSTIPGVAAAASKLPPGIEVIIPGVKTEITGLNCGNTPIAHLESYEYIL